MKAATKIFGREHLNVSKELQDNIFQSYNNHAKLIKTMRLTSANLRDLAISCGRGTPQANACHDLADRLYNATLGLNIDKF